VTAVGVDRLRLAHLLLAKLPPDPRVLLQFGAGHDWQLVIDGRSSAAAISKECVVRLAAGTPAMKYRDAKYLLVRRYLTSPFAARRRSRRADGRRHRRHARWRLQDPARSSQSIPAPLRVTQLMADKPVSDAGNFNGVVSHTYEGLTLAVLCSIRDELLDG
jgi:hypothetical protein